MALVKEVDDNWVQGRLGGEAGLVPVSYITILEPLTQQNSQDELSVRWHEAVEHIVA